MKYPFILFFRNDDYKYIDDILIRHSNNLNCTLHIINKKTQLNKFYKQIYPILIIFGKNSEEYNDDLNEITNSNLSNRILYISEFSSVETFNNLVNSFYINICNLERIHTRPTFSVFTPSFNSFEKILRAFNSLKSQTLTNWEWVIMDDSPDDKNFQYLRKH